jgi:hypothetical protein
MRSNGRPLAAALAALLLVALAGAARAQDADSLRAVWTDILGKAQAADEDGVRGELKKMLLTPEDCTAIFGEAKGAEIAQKYQAKFAEHWPNEARTLVTKVRERSYDEVEVTEVTAEQASGNERKILAMTKEGTHMFSVRLKKKNEKTGILYQCLFHVNGQWKAGLLLWKLLAPEAKKPDAAKPTEGGAKPDAPKPDEPKPDEPKPPAPDAPKPPEEPMPGDEPKGGE